MWLFSLFFYGLYIFSSSFLCMVLPVSLVLSLFRNNYEFLGLLILKAGHCLSILYNIEDIH